MNRPGLEINCQQIAEFLMGYFEGELAPDVRRRFEDHLVICRDCRVYLENYRKTVWASGIAGRPLEQKAAEAPESLVRAIIQARKA